MFFNCPTGFSVRDASSLALRVGMTVCAGLFEFERTAGDADLIEHAQFLPDARAGFGSSQDARITVEQRAGFRGRFS